jgi:phosphopantetheinyl transferase
LETTESLPDDDQLLSKLAVSVLSERELEVWRAIPSPVKRRAEFLRTRTRKEAYVKATGEGFCATIW